MEPILRAGVIVAVFLSLLAGFAIHVQQTSIGSSGFGYATMPEEIVANYSSLEFQGKVALVTGASSGIGWEVAQVLASKGFHVIVMARTYDKANEAISRLYAHFERVGATVPLLTPLACDLGSLAEIESAAQSFSDLHLPLHLLINNAAIRPQDKTRTTDGFELQMGVNYLGHSYLIESMMPFLLSSAPSRVVNVVSTLHRLSSGAFTQYDNFEQLSHNTLTAYADSKMALIVASQNLHNRYFSQGVSFYSVSPGFSSEHLEAGLFSLLYQQGARNFFASMTSRKTPRHGSASVLYAALQAPQDHSGTYFENCNIKDPKNLKIMHEATMLQEFGNTTGLILAQKMKLLNSESASYSTTHKKSASKSF